MFEIYTIDRDIEAICAVASSFPEGIEAAHERLHSSVKYMPERLYFGISRPGPDGEIVYFAAAERALEDDPDALGLALFTIRKGRFLSAVVPDFMQNIPQIASTFRALTADERVARDGFCLEMWRLHEKDLRLLVPMAP